MKTAMDFGMGDLVTRKCAPGVTYMVEEVRRTTGVLHLVPVGGRKAVDIRPCDEEICLVARAKVESLPNPAAFGLPVRSAPIGVWDVDPGSRRVFVPMWHDPRVDDDFYRSGE